MNTITRKISGDFKVSLNKQAAERLNSYVPKGCPFADYTLLDLLTDLIDMYDWKIDRGDTMSLSDFIRLLQRERQVYAVVYGEAMIQLMEV